ncbi:hypothetical protein HW555_001384 [Spodoptera exigua]|uniref:WW domain-containing oxidoreductase n=1 Tax=Spodoptera exigua TaxID=7107 RepID=A0A835GPB2_SPOEX|nr:hypothetical protein HW555_001384 [Spodoptera exigua]
MHHVDSDSEDELPSGWEQKSTEDGNVYFINTLTNKTQWTHPRTGRKKEIPKELPYGWTKTFDDENKAVYVQKDTGTKTYVDPRLAFATDAKEHVHDFRQRFDASSTAYQTAKSLARHGCSVIFANRNMESTKEAIQKILQETKASEDDLKAVHLDLCSFESVRKCATAVKSIRLDMLILNAGIFGVPYTETEDNIEMTCQVNHLSHLYLTILLEPLLKKGSRVIFVSSESHRFASLKNVFNLQNLAFPKESYSSMMAYNNSKLYNVISAKVLSEEWKNRDIYVNSLHPGNMVFTNLSKSWWLFRLAFALVRPFTKSLQQAAATTVYAATAPELRGVTGLYFNNCFYCEESAMARDKNIAHEIFALSLKMIAARVGTDDLKKYMNKFNTTQSLSKEQNSNVDEKQSDKKE